MLAATASPLIGKSGERTVAVVWAIFIAGGLHAENVEEAIQLFRPYAVDVSSGVETRGKKDSRKIEQFIHLVSEKKDDSVSHKSRILWFFGGQFVPETLMYAVKQLKLSIVKQTDASFQAELQNICKSM